MKISKCNRRDKKISKRRNGHQEDGRSVKLLRDIQKKKSLEIKREQERKESLLTLDSL
jgi:hypothetical protein